MKFAAITLGVGLAGALVAAQLQGSGPVNGAETLPVTIDATVTGAVAPRPATDAVGGVRLIDLKSGASCRAVSPPPETGQTAVVPLGPDCAKSPSLARIATWRATPDGSLIMADAVGRKVLEFAPGDGVMFESVYPPNELITIVPARG